MKLFLSYGSWRLLEKDEHLASHKTVIARQTWFAKLVITDTLL